MFVKVFTKKFNKFSLASIALALLMLLTNSATVFADPLLGGATNPADWTLSGPGTLSVTGAASPTHLLTFKYNYGGMYGQWHNWEFKAQAKSTETITFGWDYWPFHSWYQAQARLYLFADGPSGTTQQTLYDGYGYTRVNGVASINVTNGYNFGFKVHAYHYDASKITNGTLRISEAPPNLGVTGSTTYTEDASPVVVAPALTLTGGTLSGAKVSITNNFVSSQDSLGISGQSGTSGTVNGISWSYNTSTGIMNLSGSAAVSTYQTALRQVTYKNTSQNPNINARTVNFSIGENTLYYAGNGHYYEFVSASAVTWTSARDTAGQRSFYGQMGYLVTIMSQGENDFAASKLQGQGWIGASDDQNYNTSGEGVWKWVTGPEAGTQFSSQFKTGSCSANTAPALPGKYAHWQGGEPNDFCSTPPGNPAAGPAEDYAHFRTSGYWNDFPNNVGSQIAGYVVEYGGTNQDPNLSVLLTGNVTVNVQPVNDPPVAINNSYSVNEDNTLNVAAPGVLGNDTDVEGNPLTAVLVTSPGHGTVNLSGNGSFTYTPTTNYNGSDSFTYKANDGQADSNVATVTINVNSVNDPPIANAGGPYNVVEGSSVVLNGSGSDPDGNPVTLAWDLDNDGQYDDATGANPTFNAAGIDGPSVRNIALQVSETAGLFWDFENATNSGSISTSIGSPTGATISGVASQTGGGPAENFGGTIGKVHLTRFLGPVNYPYIQFTTTGALNLQSISFLHIHNHNLGFPTQNGYQVQLQIDSGSGYSNIGSPLPVNKGNSGQRSTIALGSLPLNPGTHRVRWLASGYSYGSDSNTEFFAMNDLSLDMVGPVTATSATTVTISNVAPIVNAGMDKTINEGDAFSSSGSFTDPGADTWTATVDYGDGSGPQPLMLSGKTFNLNHIYDDNGNYTITVTVKDDENATGSDTAIVTVSNVAPVVNAGPDATINEGATFIGGSAGIVASYRGEGNAAEGAGGNNGVLVGAITYGPGKVGLAFDNTSGYVEAPDSASLDINSNITIVAWIYPRSLGGRIVDKITAGGNDGYMLDTYSSRLRLIANGSGLSSSTLPIGAWVHVAGTYDGAQIRLYVNGSPSGSAPVTGPIPTNNLTLRIGNAHGEAIPFNGLIDEVRIYNGAMSAADIQALASGTPPSGAFADPGSDTFTATVNYGDGSGENALPLLGGTFSLSHVYTDNGTYTVTVKVTDDDGATGTDTLVVNVNNVAPTVNAGPDANISEGSALASSGSFTDPGADTWTATVDYGDGSGAQALTLSGKNFNLNHVYADNGSYTVTVMVTDDDGAVGTDTVSVTVGNVAPSVDAGADKTITEGSALASSGSFTDPGADTWTATVDYGDGSGAQALTLSGKNFNLSHTYADNGTYTVTVVVTDDDDGVGTDAITVTVNNVDPVVNNGPDAAINEAGTFSNSGSFTDPGADTWTATVDYGDGSGVQPLTLAGKDFSLSHSYADNGSYTITVKVTDDDGGVGTDTAVVAVSNVAPSNISASANPATIDENGNTMVSGSFTDPGTKDTHTAVIGWGDGSADTTLNLAANVLTYSASHQYLDNKTGDAAYAVSVKVTDKDGANGTGGTTVTVKNVAPAVVTLSASPATIDENGNTTVSGSFTDPGTKDTHTAVINWGDGSADTTLNLAANMLTFSASHQYLDNKANDAAYTVGAKVTDKDGASATGSTVVTVKNVAPVVNAGADKTINEGGTFSSSGSFTDPGADTWTASVDYGDGSGVQPLTLTGKNFTLSHVYADNGSYTVTVKVTDDDGGAGSDTAVVTVNNIIPAVDAGPDKTINEGSAFSSSGSFADPGADTWTASVEYGDLSGVKPLTLTGKTFGLSHTYADDGDYTVTVSVTDDDGATGGDTAVVTVNNVAPAVNAGADATINEGGTFSSSGSFTDPGADSWTATVEYGDGSGVQPLTLTGKNFALSHVFADNGSYTVTVKVTDDDGGVGSDTAVVTVNNVAPASVSVSAEPTVINENASTTVSGGFTDPGIKDNHTVVIAWGDGSADTTLNLAANVLSFFASHQYLDNKASDAPYAVSVKVTDKDGASASGSAIVTVKNVAPASVSLTGATIDENGSATVSGTFTDPGTKDSHTVLISWGDGSADTTLNLAANVLAFSASHKYLDNKPGDAVYTVGAKVTDKDGASATGSTTVTVKNVAPAAVTLSATPSTINENETTTLSGSFTDPGTLDTHTVVINWGDGSADTALSLGANVLTFNASHQYLDNKAGNAAYAVSVKVTDKDGATGTGSTNVTVNNVAPAVGAFSGATLFSGQTYTASGSFADPGTKDTWTATVDYGDGTGIQPLTLTGKNFNLNHTYFVLSAHTVTVTVTDKDGGVGSATAIVTISRLPIKIDIKPGSDPNSINLKNKGNVPVGVFSSTYSGIKLDATTVDRASLVFAGTGDLGIGKSPEDLNGDGVLDQVFHFDTEKLNLTATSTSATLTGRTSGNVYFEGSDAVRIVPAR